MLALVVTGVYTLLPHCMKCWKLFQARESIGQRILCQIHANGAPIYDQMVSTISLTYWMVLCPCDVPAAVNISQFRKYFKAARARMMRMRSPIKPLFLLWSFTNLMLLQARQVRHRVKIVLGIGQRDGNSLAINACGVRQDLHSGGSKEGHMEMWASGVARAELPGLPARIPHHLPICDTISIRNDNT